MIKIETDGSGEFRVVPSSPDSPAVQWLRSMCEDPFFHSDATDRALLQDASDLEEINEDWREYAQEEILRLAAEFREKFCLPPHGLRFNEQELPEFAAFLNRARIRIATAESHHPSQPPANSPLLAHYEFLTALLEFVVQLGERRH